MVVSLIGSSLAAVAVTGLVRPALIDPGMATEVLQPVVLVVGAAGVALLIGAAVRTSGAVRNSWVLGALVVAVWALSVAGYLAAWPDWLVWGLLRGAILAILLAGCLALLRSMTTSGGALAELLLDGWLVAASVFMISWGCLGLTGSPLSAAPTWHPALYWIPVDLVLASFVAGLAMRATSQARVAVLLTVVATLLAVVVDTTWALTGVPQFGVLLWLIMMMALAGATLVGPLDMWSRHAPVGQFPPLLRLPQWAVVPGLIMAVVPVGDPVLVVVAVSVILGLAAELALSGRQNHHLWNRLRSQAERLDRLLSESRDAIVHIDGQGVVRFANDAVCDVMGFSPDQVLGRNGLSLVHPADRRRVMADIAVLGESDCPGGRISSRVRHADGGWRSVEATVTLRTGEDSGYTLSARDVTERLSLESELRRLAGTDALTALLNRPAFVNLLDGRLRAGPATVLFVDLDGFKAVNDMDGHAAGDRLLREVADTLRRELRGPDVAARLGGDEFAVLLGTDQLAEARAVADRLVNRLRRMPSDPAGRTAASVGVATGRGVSAEMLLGDADLAMYEAKARGGRRHVMFEPWMRERVTERARISGALKLACEGEGLLLDAQPIVSMTDGRWVGFEALARWQDGPNRREPQDFLSIAEESGLIDPIGRWVLHRSLGWLARWPDRAAGISVNVAGSQLAPVGFGDWIHRQLADHGIAPDRLTLEISERTALGDLHRATAVLQPLRALGVRIALDDFGTGFSSLGHLAELPVDELKIDRRFVTGLGRRAQDDALVRAVCRLGNDLGLRVVAEGVETAAQEHTLLEHGCRLGQGYRFHPPTAVVDLAPPGSSPTNPTRRVAVPRSDTWPVDPHSRAS